MKQTWAEFKGLFTDILMFDKCDDLLSKKFREMKARLQTEGSFVHCTFGHCYIMSECAYYILGGKEEGWKPMFIRHLGCPHWFLKHESGFVLDLSEAQFKTPPDHERAIGKGFMTKKPSKRTKKLMGKILKNIKFINREFPDLDGTIDDLIMKEIEAAPEKIEKIIGEPRSGAEEMVDNLLEDWSSYRNASLRPSL